MSDDKKKHKHHHKKHKKKHHRKHKKDGDDQEDGNEDGGNDVDENKENEETLVLNEDKDDKNDNDNNDDNDNEDHEDGEDKHKEKKKHKHRHKKKHKDKDKEKTDSQVDDVNDTAENVEDKDNETDGDANDDKKNRKKKKHKKHKKHSKHKHKSKDTENVPVIVPVANVDGDDAENADASNDDENADASNDQENEEDTSGMDPALKEQRDQWLQTIEAKKMQNEESLKADIEALEYRLKCRDELEQEQLKTIENDIRIEMKMQTGLGAEDGMEEGGDSEEDDNKDDAVVQDAKYRKATLLETCKQLQLRLVKVEKIEERKSSELEAVRSEHGMTADGDTDTYDDGLGDVEDDVFIKGSKGKVIGIGDSIYSHFTNEKGQYIARLKAGTTLTLRGQLIARNEHNPGLMVKIRSDAHDGWIALHNTTFATGEEEPS